MSEVNESRTALEAVFLKVADLKKDLEDLGVDVKVTISGVSGEGPGAGVAVISLVLNDLEALKELQEVPG